MARSNIAEAVQIYQEFIRDGCFVVSVIDGGETKILNFENGSLGLYQNGIGILDTKNNGKKIELKDIEMINVEEYDVDEKEYKDEIRGRIEFVYQDGKLIFETKQSSARLLALRYFIAPHIKKKTTS